MLLRYAKLAGGLRLLIATAAPLVVTTASLLSVRTAAYLLGFGLSSILSIWLPIVLSLVALTGAIGGNTDTSICDAYRAEMRRINEYNAPLQAAYDIAYQDYLSKYQIWLDEYIKYRDDFTEAHKNDCTQICAESNDGGWACYYCHNELAEQEAAGAPIMPQAPPYPEFLTYSDGCGSELPPDCPDAKKVWLQVLWASPGGNAVDAKGCFIIAYSQDSRDLPATVQYNPFLPNFFVTQQALNYDSVTGDRFAGVDTTSWEDLDSTKGWDKGYWAAEGVDSECRGWRPGWSLKIK